MTSFFNTTANLHHVTPIPKSIPFTTAIQHLQNHDLLIRLDPELAHYESIPSPEDSPNTKCYKVTDHLKVVPAGIWDSTVTFESQITNTEDGVNWVIKAPLGLLQKTTWRLIKSAELKKDDEEGEGKMEGEGDKGGEVDDSEWSLVEDVEINASRLLVGTVKGKCEENWRNIHAKFIGHLQEGGAKA